jgi:hypothetical protein
MPAIPVNKRVVIPQTGKVFTLADITLNEERQRFFVGVFDITDHMTLEQMKTFEGFDQEQFLDNRETEARPELAQRQETSALKNFVTGFQIETGPIKAIEKAVQIGTAAAVVWLFIQMWNTFISKK